MTESEKIEREIEKTLGCFDTAQRLKADPYFYTRLRARIADEEKGRRSILRGLFSPNMLRPVFLAVVVLLNLITAAIIFRGHYRTPNTRDRYLSAFAEEYSLDLDSESSSLFE